VALQTGIAGVHLETIVTSYVYEKALYVKKLCVHKPLKRAGDYTAVL
jgi:hypothetical protein